MKIDLDVHGLKDLQEVLDAMSNTEIAKAQREACKAGADVMVEAVKELTPVKTGTLKKSIKGWKSKKNKDPRTTEFIVGPTATVQSKQTSKKKRHRGKAVAATKNVRYGYIVEIDKPYLRPAADTKGGEVLDVVEKKYIEGVKEAWKA